MIPTERNKDMVVTMTQGDLEKMIARAVAETLTKVMGDVEEHIMAELKADTLSGSKAISEALGISRDTFYSELNKGTFGDAVKHVGTRVIASRRQLFGALPRVMPKKNS